MDFDFTGKVVLITGASAGIGEESALLFAKLGAKLSLVGRNEKNLRDVADRCEKQKGVKPLAIVADLGTDEGVEKTAKETIDHFGRLDVLINNAGIGAKGTILDTDMKIFDEVFTLNVRSVYNLTRLLAPRLVETKGNIVNISSIAGTAAFIGGVPYGMTKAALDHFTRLIALELAPKGVRVNTVSPGTTVTKFMPRLMGYNEEEYQAWLSNRCKTIPMGEPALSEDVAKTIVHLASDNSRLVTGTIVEIDGASRFNMGGVVLRDERK